MSGHTDPPQLAPAEIRSILEQTLADLRLSRGERRALTALFEPYIEQPHVLATARHHAFAIARDRLRGSDNALVLDWLEEVTKALVHAENPRSTAPVMEAHFSPGDACVRRLISLCGSTRRCADVCVFTITDDRLAEALLAAHHRGVRVRVIADDEKSYDPGSDVFDLAKAGIAVRIDQSAHHMHHKFAIFDGALLASGSYNWTRSAANYNEENLVVSDDPRLLSPFQRRFDELWENFGSPSG